MLIEASGSLVVSSRLTRDVVLLPAAARTATTSSEVQTNEYGRGVVLFLDVSAAGATGALHVRLLFVDPVSGGVTYMNGSTPNVTLVGRYVYSFYPGVSGSLGASMANLVLPRSWQAVVQHDDAASYTYSLSACVIG